MIFLLIVHSCAYQIMIDLLGSLQRLLVGYTPTITPYRALSRHSHSSIAVEPLLGVPPEIRAWLGHEPKIHVFL